MNIKLCYFQKNCIVFPTKLESQNVLYLRRSKRYRLTNVDNLKKRFKVNKTELETKYYDV